MMLPQLLAVTLALAATPQLASAAIFPKNTKVKMIDAKGFREAMNQNVRLKPSVCARKSVTG